MRITTASSKKSKTAQSVTYFTEAALFGFGFMQLHYIGKAAQLPCRQHR